MANGNLDSLLSAYRSAPSPNNESALLHALTRCARSAASKAGHPDPEDLAQRIVIRIWIRGVDHVRTSMTGLVRTMVWRQAIDDHRSRASDLATEQLIEVDEYADEENQAGKIITDQHADRPCRNVMTIKDPRVRTAAAMLVVGYSVREAAEAAGLTVRHLRRKINVPDRGAIASS